MKRKRREEEVSVERLRFRERVFPFSPSSKASSSSGYLLVDRAVWGGKDWKKSAGDREREVEKKKLSE
jgi:hypothetical protein